jgi:(p)ppGpp synthase/HD superfamily hydrolase
VLSKAIQFATEAHDGQYRKGQINKVKLPFITHPLEVMKTVWRWETCDEHILCAAVLHDVVEDTAISNFMIKKEFGDKVASIVEELTFYETKKEDRDDAKNKYIESFKTKSVEALVCKMADRICNVRDRLLTKEDTVAKSYYGKAKPLIDTFHSRFLEVSKKFSFNAAQKIVYDKNKLESQLGLI